VGLFERRRRQHELEQYRDDFAGWVEKRRSLQQQLQMAREWHGDEPPEGSGFVLHDDEPVFAVIEGSALLEGKRLPSHIQGRTQGISLRLMKGVSYRVGGGRGTVTPGEMSTIDTGQACVTNKRVLFAGSLQTREWDFAQLIACQHDPEQPVTYLQVSNRQKVGGISYSNRALDEVRFRVDLALADFNDSRDKLINRLEGQLASLDQLQPTPDEAGWYPDPDGKGQRYWSGTAWTNDTAP
jgi:hypothetical protein